ncbi:MAG: hypothetical protein O2819_06885 [Planctomycetota bacterium]|nr:hypothetical protein [Planctomycetota bacterium]MDA1105181.1 hypothetical protein [Planctomycetota bacterium]
MTLAHSSRKAPHSVLAALGLLGALAASAPALAQAEKLPKLTPAPSTAPSSAPSTEPTATPADLPSVDAVMAKYFAAIGGKEAADAVMAITMKGTLSIPGTGMSGELTIWLMVDLNNIRSKMTLPGLGDVESGVIGTVGWSMNPMTGPTLMDQKDTEALRRNTDGVGTDPRNHFDTVEVTAIEPFEGKPCVVLQCTKGEDSSVQYFDRDTGLQIGSRDKMTTQMGTIEATSVIGGYKEFGQLKIPTMVTTKMMGQHQVMEFTDISFDAIDPSVFALPPEIATLVKQRDAKGAPGGADASASPAGPPAASPSAP